MSRLGTMAKPRRFQYVGLVYIAPWILGFLGFQIYPLLASVYYSFTNYNLIKLPKFVGFANYVFAFTKDANFAQSALVTILYTFTAVPLKLAFALAIALILNMRVKAIGIFRTVYYLPSIMGASVAVAVLWRFLFMKDGFLNQLLAAVNIQGPDWIGDTGFALFTISLVTVWQFGSSMVLFLAGLKQIPGELYEASCIDGAGKLRNFLHITIPMLSPILFFNLVMQIINGFQDFTAPLLITGGGPAHATYLYGLLLYDNAFKFFKMGYASALSWLLFLVIIAVTALLFKSSSLWTHYEDGGGKR